MFLRAFSCYSFIKVSFDFLVIKHDSVTPTSTSEIGNANQVKRKSISDSSQKIGIRQQIWRITDKRG